MTRLVRSELRKITTTNTWWLFLLAVLAFTAISFAFNALQAHSILHQPEPQLPANFPADQRAQIHADYVARRNVAVQAANLYTSGQYFGLLFVLLLGILVVTNEFFHQTATATFLATPRREEVVAGKLTVGVLAALALCVGTMILCVIAGWIFLGIEGVGPALTEPAVGRALLLNLLAYGIWAVVGVGFGVLVRSQVAAVIVALALYLVASQVAVGLIQLVAVLTHSDWLPKFSVVIPSVASQVMVAGGDLPGNPPQWLGALILIAYGVLAGAAGTMLTARRDIS
jgi:ABC-type transport system involved in multi-copper enzyme maturation permease subunit